MAVRGEGISLPDTFKGTGKRGGSKERKSEQEVLEK